MTLRLSSLVCLLLFNVVLSQNRPTEPFIERDICPFEYCQFGTWIARTDLVAYSVEGDTTQAAFFIAVGETFVAETGNMHMEKIGVVIVKNQNKLFPVGDTVYTLSYLGEGTNSVWHRGKILKAHVFWNSSERTDPNFNPFKYLGELKKRPKMVWWVRIRMHNSLGWLRLVNRRIIGVSFSEKIDGMSSF